VQSVRPPHLVAALAAAAALVAVAVVLLAGGGSSPPAKADPGYRKDAVVVGGKPLQQASCSEWNAASSEQRAAIVDVLHDLVGGPTPYGPATALSADDAERLFDTRCAHSYARGWLLYELYTRAAAFSGAMDRFQ
jgi:hypothetical protein